MAQNYNIAINVAGIRQAVVGVQQLAQAVNGVRGRGGGILSVASGSLGQLSGMASNPKLALAVAAIASVTAVAAASIHAFVQAVKEGSAQLAELTNARTISGGTAAQISALAAAGLGTGEIASAAAGLRGRLGNDPFAMMAGFNAGLSPQLPRPFGSQNEAEILQKAIESLRAMGEGEAQLRQARMLGLDSLLPLINVSKQMTQARARDAAVQKRILELNGPAAREFDAALTRLHFNFGVLLQSFVGPGLGRLTGFINYFADSLQGLAQIVAANPQLVNSVVDMFIKPFQTILQFMELTGQISKGSTAQFEAYIKAGAAQVTATNANTQATWQNTQAWKSGTYGGGARARGAIPNSLRGYALQRAIQGNSFRLGAFTP